VYPLSSLGGVVETAAEAEDLVLQVAVHPLPPISLPLRIGVLLRHPKVASGRNIILVVTVSRQMMMKILMTMSGAGKRKAKKKRPSVTLKTMTTTMTHLPPAAAAEPPAAAAADALNSTPLTVIANVNPRTEDEKVDFPALPGMAEWRKWKMDSITLVVAAAGRGDDLAMKWFRTAFQLESEVPVATLWEIPKHFGTLSRKICFWPTEIV
jgi:hypothetical protein